jgi:hypothetical protein
MPCGGTRQARWVDFANAAANDLDQAKLHT